MAHTKAKTNDDRPARLLRAVPTSPSIKDAMLKAGYAESTALKRPGQTLNYAIKNVSERALQGDPAAADILAEIGISREEILARYRELVLESPSHQVSLTALSPLLKLTVGLDIHGQETQKTAPPLVIGIQNVIPDAENGSTEP